MRYNKNSYRVILIWIVAVIIVFSLLFIPNKTSYKIKTETVFAEEVKEEIEKPIYLPAIMEKIAWCESKLNQEARNKNYQINAKGESYIWSTDIGVFQINDYFHLKKSKELGLDIFEEKDNIKYAMLLYEKNGTKDWIASSHCWKN